MYICVTHSAPPSPPSAHGTGGAVDVEERCRKPSQWNTEVITWVAPTASVPIPLNATCLQSIIPGQWLWHSIRSHHPFLADDDVMTGRQMGACRKGGSFLSLLWHHGRHGFHFLYPQQHRSTAAQNRGGLAVGGAHRSPCFVWLLPSLQAQASSVSAHLLTQLSQRARRSSSPRLYSSYR